MIDNLRKLITRKHFTYKPGEILKQFLCCFYSCKVKKHTAKKDIDYERYIKFKKAKEKLTEDLDIIQLIRRTHNWKVQFDKKQRYLIQFHSSQVINTKENEDRSGINQSTNGKTEAELDKARRAINTWLDKLENDETKKEKHEERTWKLL